MIGRARYLALLSGLLLPATLTLAVWSAAAEEAPKGKEKAGPRTAGKTAPPAAPSLEESLKKARAGGKYAMLLRQFKAPDDFRNYKDFHESGVVQRPRHAGQDDLPSGYWVYVYPYWYIWRDLTAVTEPKRAWGPEQATGAPDTTASGDFATAWASLTPDGQDEWLLLEYPEPVVPKAVHVHETWNPGAVNRVTAFKLDGEEAELWKGEDPTSPDAPRGVSVIPCKADFKTNRIRLHIASKEFIGWNEIDAVGLVDAAGKTQWASAALASSSHSNVNEQMLVGALVQTAQHIRALEQEVLKLKDEVAGLRKERKGK